MIINHDFGDFPARNRKNELLRTRSATVLQTLGQTLLVGMHGDHGLGTGSHAAKGACTIDICPEHFFSMTPADFKVLSPRLVLSPLVTKGFDAIDFAQKLARLGFSGRYRVMVISLPDAAMVIQEIRSHAPLIDFGVTELIPRSLSRPSSEV